MNAPQGMPHVSDCFEGMADRITLINFRTDSHALRTDQGVVALLISLPEKMDSAGISAPESTPNRVCTS